MLNLAGNRIEDLWPLAGVTALERLNLSDNRIADLWPLVGLGQLHRLDLSGSAVVDASALRRLEKLRWVWLAPETAWAPPAGRVPAR